MKLERWIVYGDCLVGYLYDHPRINAGTRVITETIRFVDAPNFEAECVDGKYKLGEPGTAEEHRYELFGEGNKCVL